MKIGELAKRSGLTASRIRFYEASGLLQAAERHANGYRHYGADALHVLDIITCAQSAGFSLDEIRGLLPVAPNAWDHGELLAGLKRKVAEIEQLQERLARSRAQLRVAIETIETGTENLACDDRKRKVLRRMREQG